MNIYLATPVGDAESSERQFAVKAKEILQQKGLNVYCPWELKIPHAWEYPNTEWGAMVFANDITALNNSDVVVVLSYGRVSSAGVNWEAGFAYAIGKRIIVVEMNYPTVMSIMVSNGCYARIVGLDALVHYDFENMTPTRTDTEQM